MDEGAFILDFNLLKEHKLSIEEFLGLIYISRGKIYPTQFISLQDKQFVKITEDKEIILREKGKLFIELISIDAIRSNGKRIIKKSSRLVNEELDGFIDDYRQLWKGRKPGSMGSDLGCKEKMSRWMKENPTFSKNDILKAAKLYLNNLDNNVYLQRADYFIFKKDKFGESSQLSAFIEEIDDRTVTDWTTNLS